MDEDEGQALEMAQVVLARLEALAIAALAESEHLPVMKGDRAEGESNPASRIILLLETMQEQATRGKQRLARTERRRVR